MSARRRLGLRRRLRLTSTRGGRLAVHLCPLCCCLVADAGSEQHERVHAATMNGGRP